jgi:hypothetical protein
MLGFSSDASYAGCPTARAFAARRNGVFLDRGGTMRFIAAALAACAIVAAFAIGRATGPSNIAQAQVNVFTHFQCYQTTTPTNFKPVTVELKDQFGVSKAELQTPNMFCAPVTKKLIGMDPHKVAGRTDHLLCYPEKNPPKMVLRKVENQLGMSVVRNLNPRWLCVPTFKYGG